MAQTFLLNLLKAVYQNQEIYPLLQQNLDKLDDEFAFGLRKWALARFTRERENASNIARLIVKFSTLIQGFEQGSPESNLEIAIAGYETALMVLTREAFPQDWASIQQNLLNAYPERHQIILIKIAKIKQEMLELLQVKLQIEDFKTAITKLTYLPKIDEFNTAIFYDIENLAVGRSNPNLNFSFKEIPKNLEQFAQFGKIAIQRAYADWSDSRISHLKNEIQQLGIEAVQIFDFGHKKNAADIQLAIDVMELVYSRPWLQVFVIVSGDGGFASLAKKLHEHGKTVIGYADEKKTNHFLKSVCDEFILIPAPEKNIEDIQIIEESRDIYDEIIVKTQQIVKSIKQNQEQLKQLREGGIYINSIHILLKNQIPNFDQKRKKKGCSSKLSDFLKEALQGTEFCLSNNNIKLILRENTSSNKIADVKAQSNGRKK
jgi:uncharacterized LabA/DUF88 family protein